MYLSALPLFCDLGLWEARKTVRSEPSDSQETQACRNKEVSMGGGDGEKQEGQEKSSLTLEAMNLRSHRPRVAFVDVPRALVCFLQL